MISIDGGLVAGCGGNASRPVDLWDLQDNCSKCGLKISLINYNPPQPERLTEADYQTWYNL
ncbi:hypothetical protein phiTE_110 [Pectobacterium phage phiTE]|uniref:Uncharacterized protein n=1 Tax=Pectobacterium phage phiTE TaxID=1116482 RepID=K9L4Z4_9CAUD|nr:hypothetical protein phiTE_110 [Pectobacterium phage phiTE]AEZ66276.1 hypothetical protein phiTE_110 [Pectobacterium phage phiTE]